MKAIKASTPTSSQRDTRLRVVIRGAVQGVGFRPFIYRLATQLALRGWVNNSAQGVFIEVEGSPTVLRDFLLRIEAEKPPRAFIQSLESSYLDLLGYAAFEIRASSETGAKTALVLPDIAACPDCLADITDPTNRRYLYPFTNCTNCGPRFTIIEALPYDRPHTTMSGFELCEACRAEYEDPLDRRFHAQPTACPACGPHLEWWTPEGARVSSHHNALMAAAEAIRKGAIVAIKGLGGFHLVVDARNDDAVQRLRQRKRREEKPFALMIPALKWAEAHCEMSELERRLLLSPESPIVLLKRRSHAFLPSPHPPTSASPQSLASSPQSLASALPPASALVAPDNPYLGVMLPYTPLHHLLMAELQFPIIATSGNLSDEPICTDEHEAVERLRGIAEWFLVHNRPIARHVDDSIVRVMMNREMVMRRARGYAPLPIHLETLSGDKHNRNAAPLIAVGAHLKNAVAASVGEEVFVSQHIGDLETLQAFDAFKGVIDSFKQLYEIEPAAIACDLHPNYLSTQHAQNSGLPVATVQHHYAHVLSCMAENGLREPVLGIAWDGTGYGTDGTIWGGEFLRVTPTGCESGCACRHACECDEPQPFQRVAHLKTFRLPGGDRAVKEPRRAAIGVLYEIFGEALFDRDDLAPVLAFDEKERGVLKGMLARNVNAPVTSSAGRLFDAIAAIIDLRQQARFEGQAAMGLEFALEGANATDESYTFQVLNSRFETHEAKPVAGSNPSSNIVPVANRSAIVIDWSPMILALLDDVKRQAPVAVISAKFHNTLCEMMVAIARRIGDERVALSGGCFQNRYLTERAVRRLEAEGFRAYWHQRVPPNDGGIALGQAMAAMRVISRDSI